MPVLPSFDVLIFRALALLIAAPIHEYAHALAADMLGDPTARRSGRLTLNPLAHLDPLGTILILTVGFGWAKPVPINPSHFSDWRRGVVVVGAAGPLANVVLALVCGLPFKAGLPIPAVAAAFLFQLVLVNAVLAVFNLLPVPPLDGSRIVEGLLPVSLARSYYRLQPFGVLILLGLIFLGVTDRVLGPGVLWLFRQATGSG